MWGSPKVTKVTKDRSSRSSNFYQEPRASLPRCEAHQDPSCQAGSRQLGLGKMVKSQTADDGGKLGDIKVLTIIIWLKSKTITPWWTWWWWWWWWINLRLNVSIYIYISEYILYRHFRFWCISANKQCRRHSLADLHALASVSGPCGCYIRLKHTHLFDQVERSHHDQHMQLPKEMPCIL